LQQYFDYIDKKANEDVIDVPLNKEDEPKLEQTDDEIETERLNIDGEEQPTARFVFDMYKKHEYNYFIGNREC